MTLVDILLVILIASASALCIALIFYLSKVTKSFNSMQSDLNEISKNFGPLINSLSELTEKLTSVTESAQTQLDVSRNIVYSVKDRVDKILEIEDEVVNTIEGPLLSAVKNIKALSNGVNSFFNYFKK
jgi:uncharacterized protein YoxC